MNDSDLKAIFRAEERSSLSYIGGQLSADRAKAMDYYFQSPFGNEVEGRSQVVTSDVADTVDWILPSLLRIFTAGPEVVRFDPTGPEDEEQAAQATDYVNYVFNVENPGFMILHAWFKDALLQKNGIVKIARDDSEKPTISNYPRLAPEEAELMAGDADVTVISRTENEDGTVGVSLRKSKEYGCTVVSGVPPEEFLISRDARTIDDARFVGHRVRKLASDLVADGYSRSLVDRIPGDETAENTAETESRSRYEDNDTGLNAASMDRSTRQIIVTEGYLRVDYDGDGIAELRMVTMAGEEILENEPVDVVPFADLTPIPMSHKWTGRGVADLVMDLQLIRSTILRQMLDNLYLVNNARMEVVSDQVNLDDLLTSRPGGIVRTRAPGMVKPLEVPPVFQHGFPVLEWLSSEKEKRTGVTSYNQGLDANSLNKTATGITNILAQAQQRIELIARIFAETGVRRLFKMILSFEQKFSRREKIIRLRNKWVPMDPRNWSTEMDCSVAVGLGTGNKDQMLGQLMNIGGIMKEYIALQGGVDGPFVTRNNLWSWNKRVAENAGFKSPEEFFSDPTQPGPDGQMQPAKAQDPAAMAEQMKAQIEAEKIRIDQARLQGETISQERQDALKAQEIQLKHVQEMAKLEVAVAGQQQQAQIEGAKMLDGQAARGEQREAEMQGRVMDRQAAREDAEASRGHEKTMKNSERMAEGQPIIDHEAEMQKIADAIMQAGQAQQESMMQAMQALAQAQMQQTQALVQAITAPKETKLIRDAAGNPIASQQVTVGA